MSFQSFVLSHLVIAGTRPQLTKKLAGKRGANFLILNQVIFTEYCLRCNTVYTKDAPFNISQGFLIIMDNIKNELM